MNVVIKAIAIISRILLGAVFIFSGFVKGIDPWGSTYKFTDYLTAFDMTWMHSAAFALALLQNVVEIVIGVTLVLGLRMKESAWGVLLFMGFYTPLTLILALTNPVSDCGCFGDALILTNWQTFYKNLVLMIPTLIVFLYRKKYKPAYSALGEWSWVVIITAVVLWISIDCYNHLPWIDFRPYHIGADIQQGMIVPEGMPADEYYSTVFMEKNGELKEFPVNDYPWDDSAWVYVDTKTVLVKKGYEPPIHDFSITTEEGEDITEMVLSDEGYTFLLVAHRLSKSDRNAMLKASEIAEFCNDNGHKFYCLTAAAQTEINQLKSELKLSYDFCFTDDITLKTIIRANPGLVLLQKGVVTKKWHFNDMPEVDDLNKQNLLSFAMKSQTDISFNRLINTLLLSFVFFAFVFFHYRKF